MNQDDAKAQIDQMIAFIIQEAREKAEEIEVASDSQCMADQLRIKTEAGIAIRKEFQAMRKEKKVQKRIERSKQVTEAHFEVMSKREEKMIALKAEVSWRLADICKQKQYPQLLQYLLAEGLMQVHEKRVTVKCRKEDLAIVKKLLKPALETYQSVIKKATGIVPPCELSMATTFLPAGPTEPNQKTDFCCGGVELICRGGKLVCRNTLDSRLEICFNGLLPSLRGLLFGVRPDPVNKAVAEEKSHH